MKVYVLVDNAYGIGFRGEWGLSFYIEYNGKTMPCFPMLMTIMRMDWTGSLNRMMA